MNMDIDEDDYLILNDDTEFYVAAIGLVEKIIEDGEELRNNDGNVRRVHRDDYSRGPKRNKSAEDPWNIIPWLIEIRDPLTADPRSNRGKEFQRMDCLCQKGRRMLHWHPEGPLSYSKSFY